jgi:hypothetical protein
MLMKEKSNLINTRTKDMIEATRRNNINPLDISSTSTKGSLLCL